MPLLNYYHFNILITSSWLLFYDGFEAGPVHNITHISLSCFESIILHGQEFVIPILYLTYGIIMFIQFVYPFALLFYNNVIFVHVHICEVFMGMMAQYNFTSLNYKLCTLKMILIIIYPNTSTQSFFILFFCILSSFTIFLYI